MMAVAMAFHAMEIYLRIRHPTCAGYIADAIVFMTKYHDSSSFVLSIQIVCLMERGQSV
jgi:hypothetical protein